VRTSPPVARGRTLAPPRLAAPPPPSRGGGGTSRVDTQQHRRSTPPPVRTPPSLLPASPSPGIDSGWSGAVQACTPRPPASPSTGVAGRSGGTGPRLTPSPNSRPLPGLAPSWASIVQGGVHTAAPPPPAVSKEDFLAFYERCTTSGLRASSLRLAAS
jgi:hypothetical protein